MKRRLWWPILLVTLTGIVVVTLRMVLPSPGWPPHGPADQPVPRKDEVSLAAHERLLARAKQGPIEVFFLGDSLVQRWASPDYPDLLANWETNFEGWAVANFGWGADRTEHILWRLHHGELDDVHPRVIVIQAGTNNVGFEPGDEEKVADITRGLRAIVDLCRQKAPDAAIVLMAIFPRNDNMAVMPEIARINRNLAAFADGTDVRVLDINDRLADRHDRLFDGVAHERDQLHLTVTGYQIWADALKPILTELIGPPAVSTRRAVGPRVSPAMALSRRPAA